MMDEYKRQIDDLAQNIIELAISCLEDVNKRDQLMKLTPAQLSNTDIVMSILHDEPNGHEAEVVEAPGSEPGH